MGFAGFVSGFCGGLMIISATQVIIGNVFITSFVGGLVIGVLSAMVDW